MVKWKLIYTKRAQDDMEAIYESIAALSDEELQVLIDAYESGQFDSEDQQVNPLILEQISKYAKEKETSAQDLSDMIDEYESNQAGDEEITSSRRK